MSKDDRRNTSCTGKRLYLDFPTARKMAKRTNNDRDARVQPYHCCTCHGWHVGDVGRIPKKPRPRVEEDACQD